jgi:hypothetical protein
VSNVENSPLEKFAETWDNSQHSTRFVQDRRTFTIPVGKSEGSIQDAI